MNVFIQVPEKRFPRLIFRVKGIHESKERILRLSQNLVYRTGHIIFNVIDQVIVQLPVFHLIQTKIYFIHYPLHPYMRRGRGRRRRRGCSPRRKLRPRMNMQGSRRRGHYTPRLSPLRQRIEKRRQCFNQLVRQRTLIRQFPFRKHLSQLHGFHEFG